MKLTSALWYAIFMCLLASVTCGEHALCTQKVNSPVCARPPSSVLDDRRQDKGEVTFATFNAEWLFDGIGDEHTPWKGHKAASEHTNKVADTLTRLHADVIHMVEVEGCFMLEEVTRAMSATDYSVCVREGTDTHLRQQVGLISRVTPHQELKRSAERVYWPLRNSRCGFQGKGKTSGVSKHYWTVLRIPGLSKELLLVGLHFKAIPNQERKCAEREAQATVIRNIVAAEGLEKNRLVVVMGDFNDFESKFSDAVGSTPKSTVMEILRNVYPDVGQDELINVAELLPQQDRRTNWWDKNRDGIDGGIGGGEHSMIDHILISRELKPLVKKVWIDRSAHMSAQGRVSDHWPIAVTIATPDGTTWAD